MIAFVGWLVGVVSRMAYRRSQVFGVSRRVQLRGGKRKGGRGVVASGIQVCGVVVVSKRLVRVRCPIRVCLFDVES